MAASKSRPNFVLFKLPGGTVDAIPEPVEPGSFQDLGALEVQHLEKWLAERPEVLGEDLLIITRQFAGFDKTKERSDILGLDRAGRLVVVELKRDDSGSRQDLQALRYGATSANLSVGQLLELYVKHRAKHHNEVISGEQARTRFEDHVIEGGLDGIDEDIRPRIVLVAKSFQWEVASTCLWLREAFGVDISCVQLLPYKVEGQVLLASSVLIPLPEASQYIAQREEKQHVTRVASQFDWDKAVELIAAIPPGHWATYQEVAEAAGGGGKFAGRGLGQKLLKANAEELPDSVHRVLRWDGSVSPGWVGKIGDAAACKALLESEGLTFDAAGRADGSRHVDLATLAAEPEPLTTGPSPVDSTSVQQPPYVDAVSPSSA